MRSRPSAWRRRCLGGGPTFFRRGHIVRLPHLIGIDRDEDFVDAEREEPGCVLLLTDGGVPSALANGPDELLDAVRRGRWCGRATQLSEDHIQWTFIDDVASATEDPGRAWPNRPAVEAAADPRNWSGVVPAGRAVAARPLVLQRRSALAFDARSSIDAETFFGMLARTMPALASPTASVWWTPRIHLLLFVHRVTGVAPGLYLFGRAPGGFERLQREIRSHDMREPAHDSLPLVCLGRGDCRSLARRLSCDQDIASDGCFSLGMIADFDASLAEYGRFVLPPSLLGIGGGRTDSLSRSGSGTA